MTQTGGRTARHCRPAVIDSTARTGMTGFTAWIEREFPEFGEVDPRLVTVASKAYRYFQSSDLNK